MSAAASAKVNGHAHAVASEVESDTSASTQRMRSAGVRAVESYQRLGAKAARLIEEMDELTPVHGVATAGLSDEDSVVTSIAAVIDAHAARSGNKEGD